MPHKFDPAHVEELDRPDRQTWQPAAALLDAVDPGQGSAYADLGCGTGYFAIPAAKRVAPSGKVYGLDVQPAMLDELRSRAKQEGVTNLIALQSEESRIPLPAAGLEAVWSVNTFHELEAPLALLYETFRILAPGGKAFLVDWKPIETPMGPPMEERVPADRIKEALKAAGFTAIREHRLYAYHHVVEGAKRGGKR